MSVEHTYKDYSRSLRKTITVKKKITRGQAIRKKCLDCSAWQPGEVRRCPVETCALWPFRMGSLKAGLKADQAN